MEAMKILAIAPYKGLKELLEEAAVNYDSIELDYYIADMSQGVSVARSLNLCKYNAIISRAGSVKLLEEISPIPVVDVGIGFGDMCRAVKMASERKCRFAVVAFPMISHYAYALNDFLSYDVEIHTVCSEDEIFECLSRLSKEGCGLIVGDVITTTHAKGFNFDTILITSDINCAHKALEECVRWLGQGEINLNGTLDDIIDQVVDTVLKQENMNRSKTARRLGISRSTLWRRRC